MCLRVFTGIFTTTLGKGSASPTRHSASSLPPTAASQSCLHAFWALGHPQYYWRTGKILSGLHASISAPFLTVLRLGYSSNTL